MTDQNALSITELQQKAEMGDAQAQLELAYRFSDGEGIESNKEMAWKCLTSAAESGNSEAQLALGFCLSLYFSCWCDNNDSALHRLARNTLITNWDDNLSISWISKSAEQNNSEAQYSLYKCYINEIGVNRNIELALAWLTKSANNGLRRPQKLEF
jgi:TPR repeat protein